MNKSILEQRQTLIFRLAFTVVIMALVIMLTVIGMEGYVRWVLNRDFVLLGGYELETLTASMFILILGMMYLNRPGESHS